MKYSACVAALGLAGRAYAIYQSLDINVAVQSRSNNLHVSRPEPAPSIRLQRRALTSGKPEPPSRSQSPLQRPSPDRSRSQSPLQRPSPDRARSQSPLQRPSPDRSKSQPSLQKPSPDRSRSQSPHRPKPQENPRSPKSPKLTTAGLEESPSKLNLQSLPSSLQYPLRNLASLQNSPSEHEPTLLGSPLRHARLPSPDPLSSFMPPISPFQSPLTRSPRAQSPRSPSRSPSPIQNQASQGSGGATGMLKLRLSSHDIAEINQALWQSQRQAPQANPITVQGPHAQGPPVQQLRELSPPAAAHWQPPLLVHSPSESGGSSERSGGVESGSSRESSPGPSSRSASQGDAAIWHMPKDKA